MPRPIDADALKDVIQQHDYPLADRINSIDNGMFTLGIFQAIDEQPTITPDDLRPVVRGEWYMKTMTVPGGHGRTYGKYGCSICMHKVERRSNFCPNCGAQMKGAEDGTTE